MEIDRRLDEELEKLTRRGFYCLVMGAGAFFAHFNSLYAWVTPPEYKRVKGAWLDPVMPALEPVLPLLVVALGVGFLAYAVYCLYRYRALTKSGG